MNKIEFMEKFYEAEVFCDKLFDVCLDFPDYVAFYSNGFLKFSCLEMKDTGNLAPNFDTELPSTLLYGEIPIPHAEMENFSMYGSIYILLCLKEKPGWLIAAIMNTNIKRMAN